MLRRALPKKKGARELVFGCEVRRQARSLSHSLTHTHTKRRALMIVAIRGALALLSWGKCLSLKRGLSLGAGRSLALFERSRTAAEDVPPPPPPE